MLYLGTSDWKFDHWTNGFYSSSNKDEWLKEYSSKSSFCEIKSSFHDLPSEEEVDKWFNDTPKHFIFAPVLSKSITSSSNEISRDKVEEFFNRFADLKNKLGIVTLQLPKKLQYGEEPFKLIQDLILACRNFFPGFFVLDLRNRSWHKPDVVDFLKKNDGCLLTTDKRITSSSMANPEFYFLRLQGDTRLVPREDFGKRRFDRKDDLKNWAEHIKFKARRHKKVFVSIDNHFSGNAVRDAYSLGDNLLKLNSKKFYGFRRKVDAK